MRKQNKNPPNPKNLSDEKKSRKTLKPPKPPESSQPSAEKSQQHHPVKVLLEKLKKQLELQKLLASKQDWGGEKLYIAKLKFCFNLTAQITFQFMMLPLIGSFFFAKAKAKKITIKDFANALDDFCRNKETFHIFKHFFNLVKSDFEKELANLQQSDKEVIKIKKDFQELLRLLSEIEKEFNKLERDFLKLRVPSTIDEDEVKRIIRLRKRLQEASIYSGENVLWSGVKFKFEELYNEFKEEGLKSFPKEETPSLLAGVMGKFQGSLAGFFRDSAKSKGSDNSDEENQDERKTSRDEDSTDHSG